MNAAENAAGEYAAAETPRLSPLSLAELAHLSDGASRARFFATHQGFLHAAVVEQLADLVSERMHVDVNEATALAEAAVIVGRRVGCDDALARALRAKANAHRFRNEPHLAVQLFAEAAELFTRTCNRIELGRTLSSSIKSHILLGEYASAFEAAEQARTIFAELGDERRLARLEINLANILHRQDRIAEALDHYERAYERLMSLNDVEGIGVSLHNMAVCLIVLNDFERALATYRRARAHCERAGMRRLVAQADYNIAYLYFLRGNYSRALELLRAARVACSAAGDLYHAALCSLDQAEIYLEVNLNRDAADVARDALEIFEKLGNGYERARALTCLALGQRHDTARAMALLDEARVQFVREQNAAWPSVIDLYRAFLLAGGDCKLEAQELARTALEAFSGLRLHRMVAVCELLLARVSLGASALPDAAAHGTRALALAKAYEAPALEHEAYFVMGQILEASGHPADAYRSYRAAHARLESLRSLLAGDDLRIAFMTNKGVVYERLVDLCLKDGAGDQEQPALEIFGYIEAAKSRSLRDAFFDRVHPLPPLGTGQREPAERIARLREELNWCYRRIEHEQLTAGDCMPASLERLYTVARRREQAFLKALRELPALDLASIGVGNAGPATVESIRAECSRETTLVEYFRTGERILAVVLTRQDLRVVPVTTVARVKAPLRTLHFQLSRFQAASAYPDRMGVASDATHAHLQELHRELIEPLGLKSGGHLVFIPHGVLHSVPFHALFDGTSYVMDGARVSYAPSASIYALCCQRPSPSAQRSLVLGIPDDRAPRIADEVHEIAALLPHVDVRMGADASLDTLQTLGRVSRIVHIATHGSFRADNPVFSGVRLGDSYLTVYDLSRLPLPVDLIALSGCGTGLSVVSDGDELQGLTTGLLAAGARSVLVTLWDVHDRSTARFMKFFYQGIEAGLGKAAAVRDAAGQLRREYDHPFYWAPFVLVGADAAGMPPAQ